MNHGVEPFDRRLRDALDPLLPAGGAEERVLQRFRESAATHGTASHLGGYFRRRRLATAAMAFAVAMVLGGTLAGGLALRSHSASRQAHPSPPAGTPYPPTPAPAQLGGVEPLDLSFVDADAGWVLGRRCDAQARCALAVARTGDGGRTWTLVAPPLDPSHDASDLHITAGSSLDAWVWGNPLPSGLPGDNRPEHVFRATHDGGATWQSVTLPDGAVGTNAMSVEGTSVWAASFCASGASSCDIQLFTSAVEGGAWTEISAPHSTIHGGGGHALQLLRQGGRSFVLDYGVRDLWRSDDAGRTWTVLGMPCLAQRSYLAASSPDHLLLACVDLGAWPSPQEVWSSHDGGLHWTLRSRVGMHGPGGSPLADVGHLGNQGAPAQLAVVSDTTAWMANDRGPVLVTHDDGVTWTAASLPDAQFGGAGGAEGITFPDAAHGWTFVPSGVWATGDGGAHWAHQPILGPIPR